MAGCQKRRRRRSQIWSASAPATRSSGPALRSARSCSAPSCLWGLPGKRPAGLLRAIRAGRPPPRPPAGTHQNRPAAAHPLLGRALLKSVHHKWSAGHILFRYQAWFTHRACSLGSMERSSERHCRTLGDDIQTPCRCELCLLLSEQHLTLLGTTFRHHGDVGCVSSYLPVAAVFRLIKAPFKYGHVAAWWSCCLK